MIRLPAKIFMATGPVNLHFSFDRLAGIVREEFGGDPRGQALFIFHNRRRTHLKLLWHDGGGYCLLYKRLDRSTFRIPIAVPANGRRVEISERELRVLFQGIDSAIVRAAKRSASA